MCHKGLALNSATIHCLERQPGTRPVPLGQWVDRSNGAQGINGHLDTPTFPGTFQAECQTPEPSTGQVFHCYCVNALLFAVDDLTVVSLLSVARSLEWPTLQSVPLPKQLLLERGLPEPLLLPAGRVSRRAPVGGGFVIPKRFLSIEVELPIMSCMSCGSGRWAANKSVSPQ